MKSIMSIFSVLLPMIVNAVISGLSPDIRKFLTKVVNDLDKKAKATANPFDDALVEILRSFIPPNGM